MYLIRNISLFLIVLYVALASSSSLALEDKFIARVAVVDVESILEHSTASAHLKKVINEISDLIQEEFIVKKNELKNIESDLIARRGDLGEDEFEKLVAEFNQKVSALQKEIQSKKNALEQAHAESYSEIHRNTIVVINHLSEKYGFNIVFPSTQVLFVTNEINITLEVISDLNKRLKTTKLNYRPDISSGL